MALTKRDRLLLSRFLDGACDDEEARKAGALLGDHAEARDHLADLARLDAALPAAGRHTGRRRLLVLVGAAAAVLLLAGGVLLLLMTGRAAPPAAPAPKQVAHPEPEPVERREVVASVFVVDGVAIVRRDGQERGAEPGMELFAGDELSVPERDNVYVRLTNGPLICVPFGSAIRMAGTPRRITLLEGGLSFEGSTETEPFEVGVPGASLVYQASREAAGWVILTPGWARDDPASLIVHLGAGELLPAGSGDEELLTAPLSMFRAGPESGLSFSKLTLEWGGEGIGREFDQSRYCIRIREPGSSGEERYQMLSFPRLSIDPRLALADLLEQARFRPGRASLDGYVNGRLTATGWLDTVPRNEFRVNRIERFRRRPGVPQPVRTVKVNAIKLDQKSLMALVGAPVWLPKELHGKTIKLARPMEIAPEALLTMLAQKLHLTLTVTHRGYSLKSK